MNFGQSAFGVTQNRIAGAPFPANSADNGLSVDGISGRIVLGNDELGAAGPAVLLSNREIEMAGFLLRLLQADGTEDLGTLLLSSGAIAPVHFGMKLGVEGATITKRGVFVSEATEDIDGQSDNWGVFQGNVPLP